MNRLIIVLITILLLTTEVYGQSLQPKVIGTLGGYTAPSGGPSLRYNLGETFVATLQTGSSMLTEGFEQPLITTSSLPSCIPTSGLIAWYPFTGNANDSSGNGHNGIVSGATLSTDRFGNVNCAYSFDGLNNYIHTDSALLTGVVPATFSFWAKTSSTSSMDVLGQACGTDCDRDVRVMLSLAQSECGIQGLSFKSPAFFATSPFNPNDAIWHHYVLIMGDSANYSYDNFKFYIDGSLIPVGCGHNWGGWTYNIADNPFTIGKPFLLGNYFNGLIDDIAVYNRALATAEILQLYNANIDVGNISGASAVCTGSALTLSDLASSGTWSSSNISAATIGSTGIVTGITAGTTTISYTVTNSCGSATTTKVISVNPLPSAGTITGTATVSIGGTTPFTDTTTGGTWSSSNTTKATVSSAGVVTGVTAGTAIISYNVTNGCGIASAVKVVTINSTTTCIPSDGLVAWYPFTGNANDSSGNYINGTVFGASLTEDRFGSANKAYSFNGTTDYIEIPYSPLFDNSNYSFSFWVKTTISTPSYGGPNINVGIMSRTASGGPIDGPADADNWVVFEDNGSSALATAGSHYGYPAVANGQTFSSISDNIWHHVVFTISEDSAICYMDGVKKDANYFTNHIIYQPYVTRIGRTSHTYWKAFQGSIDDISIYNRALTSTEIIQLYTGISSTNSIIGLSATCVGTTTILSDSTTGGTWSSSNISAATIGSTGIVTGVAAGTTTISYTVTNTCGSATTTKVISVNPVPSAGIITGTPTVITSGTTTFTDTTTGGAWSSSNTTKATVSSTGVVMGVAAGTATISYTVTNGCGTATATRVVTVSASTAAAITGTMSLCAGTTTTLSDATAGGTWHSSNSAVATVGVSNGIITAISAGTTTISYTIAGSMATAVVTVNTVPAVIGGAATACVGMTNTLTDATAGGTWASSNDSIGTVNMVTGVVTGMAAGAITITYSLSTGCYKTKAVTVNAAPMPIGGPTAICIGGTTTLTNATAGAAAWASSTPSVATIVTGSGMITGVAAGTTTISYTLTTGCRTTTVVTVTAAPTITGAASVCVAAPAAFAISGTGGTWSSSATTIATIGSGTGIVTGVAAGAATITYLTAGCRSTKAIVVNALPAVITGALGICVGSTGALSSVTGGGTWSSANAAVATAGSTGIVTGITSDTVTIRYTLGTGCVRGATVTVTAAPAITGITNICGGNAVTLSPTISGGTWSSSAAGIATIGSATGVLTGVSNGTANITYTLGAGCRTITTVTVGSAPAAITGADAVCSGGTASVADATAGGTWSSSNTTVVTVGAATGILTGVAVGSATITYATGAGCYRTKSINVGFGAATVTAQAGMCVGTNVDTFRASITGAAWSSSNTAVVTIGVLSGLASGITPGTAVITFTPNSTGSAAGCVTTMQVTVSMGVTLAAITGVATIGIGGTTTLADATTGGLWSSSNTASAIVGTGSGVVTGISAGLIPIYYTVTHGACVQITSRVVNVTAHRPATAITDKDAELRVYPNPTTGAFSVKASESGTFTIYTLEGKQLQQCSIAKGINELQLPKGIAAGIYMCRYNGDDGSTVMVRLVYEQ